MMYVTIESKATEMTKPFRQWTIRGQVLLDSVNSIRSTPHPYGVAESRRIMDCTFSFEIVPKIRHPSIGIGNLLKIGVSGDLAIINNIFLIFIFLNLNV